MISKSVMPFAVLCLGLLNACSGDVQIVQQTPAADSVATVISGSPQTQVAVGSTFNFTPAVTRAAATTLVFSISGKPPWASFNTATGELTGRPSAADARTYDNIVISVTYGGSTVALPAFNIAVVAAAGTGRATLSWTAPTLNSDGTPLTDLTGYRVYHGNDASALIFFNAIGDASVQTFDVSNLAAGTHYFAVTAVNSAGNESAFSTISSKTIP